MRVAFIALHFAEYSAHLATALAELHDVLLVLYRDNADNELGPRLREEFVHPRLTTLVLERPRGVGGIAANARRLIGEVRRFAPDVVHLQEDLRDELVLALPFMRRAPLLMTIHDPSNHSGHDAQRFRFSRFRLYRALVRGRIDGAFAHGKALAREVEAQLPQLRGRTTSIPHGPLGPHRRPAAVEPARPSSFLFFGRLHEYKGLRYFVEAIQRLHRDGLPVRGIIAGRGTDLKPNLPLIEQTPAAFEVIEKYISEDEVRRLFLETTAAVLPYVDGTQSGVAAMALGYGRPVIASRVGSIPELVRHEVNGLLVEARDVDALTAAMRKVAVDAQAWQQLASGACALRDGELSWREIARTTTTAYDAARKQGAH